MPLRHTLLALAVVLIWGVNFVVIDVGLADVPPFVFLALRFALVAVPAVFFVKPPTVPWWKLALLSVFMSFGQFALLYLAIAVGMPAGLASLVLQAQVVFTIVLGAVVLRERPSPRQIVGVGIGVAGLAIVGATHGQGTPLLPLLLTVAAGLSWGIGNIVSRTAKGASGLSIVVWGALFVPIPALLMALLVDGPEGVAAGIAAISPPALASTAYTVVLATLVAYTIWNTLLGLHAPAKVAPFTLLVPFVGILSAWLLLGEEPGVGELVGGAVMIAGLAVATLRLRRRPVPVG
jgi:O-acetylserine/cysteine efflux transporter